MKPASKTLNHLLDQLDGLRSRFEPRGSLRLEQLLSRIGRANINDAESLIRFHELLLFICAYPQSARARRLAESLLRIFPKRIQALRDAEIDLDSLEHPEVSGVAGLSVTDTFAFFIVRWLLKSHPRQVSIYWDWFEAENRLGQTWPRFMPLLEDDAAVEANIPFQDWLRAARPRGEKDLQWLVRQFDSLDRTEKEKAELYDSQQLYVNWKPAYGATRTGMRLPVRKVFFHREPLLRRKDVSLRTELEKPLPPLELLSPKQGEAMLDMAREASTTRYRELYGFTHGDAKRVFKTNIGRGVDIVVTGLPAEWRLPLRAYHAALIFKNGVPVGYFEGLSLFERMESGFNLYYQFRDGETAWLYARLLNIFRRLLGVTAFSLDPYQIGHENEEGIESGAFWFYRKLGFRPTEPEIRKLVAREEEKLAARNSYRTSAATLRKLAAGPMIFELDQSHVGDWDRFQVRNLGFAAQRQMALKFKGDAERMRDASVKSLTKALRISTRNWRETELTALRDFAVLSEMIRDLGRWTTAEKQQLVQIIQAKGGRDEARYLKLMQKHARLRQEVIRLGS
ncbi:MAG TPA: hypothetical protein DC047_02605 [Blastocatellia bacterium]|nr:hypothetical protein [Blastocatellia bacterium]